MLFYYINAMCFHSSNTDGLEFWPPRDPQRRTWPGGDTPMAQGFAKMCSCICTSVLIHIIYIYVWIYTCMYIYIYDGPSCTI